MPAYIEEVPPNENRPEPGEPFTLTITGNKRQGPLRLEMDDGDAMAVRSVVITAMIELLRSEASELGKVGQAVADLIVDILMKDHAIVGMVVSDEDGSLITSGWRGHSGQWQAAQALLYSLREGAMSPEEYAAIPPKVQGLITTMVTFLEEEAEELKQRQESSTVQLTSFTGRAG